MEMREGPEGKNSGPSWADARIRDYWEWSYLGLCKDPKISKLFGNSKNIKSAKIWCDICPVADDCLIFALIYKESGIWGGTTDSEREKIPKDVRERLIFRARSEEQYYDRQSPGALIRQFLARREGPSEE